MCAYALRVRVCEKMAPYFSSLAVSMCGDPSKLPPF